MYRTLLILWALLLPMLAFAGAQRQEDLSAAVATAMQRSVGDTLSPHLTFANAAEGQAWLAEMSRRLTRLVPDAYMRNKLLIAIQYESARAGLDPQMVLGLIEVESGFRSFAISSAGARGLMQVMPFWVRQIGAPDQNLFDMYTNLRYGCTILRHYIDLEQGDLYRALGRYNGSVGQPQYPDAVLAAWKVHWHWHPERMRVLASADVH